MRVVPLWTLTRNNLVATWHPISRKHGARMPTELQICQRMNLRGRQRMNCICTMRWWMVTAATRIHLWDLPDVDLPVTTRCADNTLAVGHEANRVDGAGVTGVCTEASARLCAPDAGDSVGRGGCESCAVVIPRRHLTAHRPSRGQLESAKSK